MNESCITKSDGRTFDEYLNGVVGRSVDEWCYYDESISIVVDEATSMICDAGIRHSQTGNQR